MTKPLHAITSLTLENFRNYRTLSLTVSPQPVVLRGANGAGKTNILEAISLLSPGRGLRGARLRDMDHLETFPWVAAATISLHDETAFIGTGRDSESASEKRIIKINGEKVKSHAALAAHSCIQWLTPSMDRVFIDGGAVRRKFFDRIVYGFAPAHAMRVAAYEGAMRERNRLLSDGRENADPYWLSVLERQMAEHGVAITLARQDMLLRITGELAENITNFPRALLRLNGTLETMLGEGYSALETESIFAERLELLRSVDASRGRTTAGSHCSEIVVIHQEKDRPAENCSTGEQKALLLSITLAAARARAAWCGAAPILLLDEVIAHLDVDKRSSLFDLIRQCKIQAWMTGTDAADFKGLEGFSTILEVDAAVVKKG